MELIDQMASLICNPEKKGLDRPLWKESESRVVLTDGAIAITFFNQKERSESWGEFPDKFDRIIKFCDQAGTAIDVNLPAIEPEEWWKKPFEQVKDQCEECWGTGKVTCNYGHEHECEECDGSGSKMSTALERYIDLPEVGCFDKRYAWIVGQLAQHRQLQFNRDNLANGVILQFSFEDGNGVLMSVQRR